MREEKEFKNMSIEEKIESLNADLKDTDVDELSEDQFVEYCCAYAKKMVLEMTGRDMPIRYTKDRECTASTDGKSIKFSLNGPTLGECDDRKTKFTLFRGLICHEIAHVLYTDFKNDNKWRDEVKFLKRTEPELLEVQELMRDNVEFYVYCRTALFSIENIIEDERIEILLAGEWDNEYTNDLHFYNEFAKNNRPESSYSASTLINGLTKIVFYNAKGISISDENLKGFNKEIIDDVLKMFEDNKDILAAYRTCGDDAMRNQLKTELYIRLVPALMADLEESKKRNEKYYVDILQETFEGTDFEIMKYDERIDWLHNELNDIDVELLDEDGFAQYCKKYAMMMNYDLTEKVMKVELGDKKNAMFMSYNDGKTITIHFNWGLLESVESRKEKFRLFKGSVYHEIAYDLYTDYRKFNKWCNKTIDMTFDEPELKTIQEKMKLDKKFHDSTMYGLWSIQKILENERVDQELLTDPENEDVYIDDLKAYRELAKETYRNRPIKSKRFLKTFVNALSYKIAGIETTAIQITGVSETVADSILNAINANADIIDEYVSPENKIVDRYSLVTQMFARLAPVIEADWAAKSTTPPRKGSEA